MTQSSDRARRNLTGTGLVHFSSDALEQIDEALEALIEASVARCALLIDRTGCIVSSSGDFHPISQENMGAVAAGVIAALNAMVSRASSPEVSVKFYGAEIDKIHYVVVADRLILCMLHGRSTTSGQIRGAAKEFVTTVTSIIGKDKVDESENKNLVKSVQYIESKLNEMFKDLT